MPSKTKKTKRLYRVVFNKSTLSVSYTILEIEKETKDTYYLANGQHVSAADVYDYYYDNNRSYSYRNPLSYLFGSDLEGHVYMLHPVTAKIRKELIDEYLSSLKCRIKTAGDNMDRYNRSLAEAVKEKNDLENELKRVEAIIHD